MGIFRLDDRSDSIEAVIDERGLETYRELLKEDELVILQARVQPDRFSGGVRLNVQQMWDLPAARARFGRYLSVSVASRALPVSDVLSLWPAKVISSEEGQTTQGLRVRVRVCREAAQGEIDLGDAARFWPVDEALGRWKSLAHEGQAQVVYEAG